MRFAGFVAKLFAEPIIMVKNASAELAKGNLDIKLERMYPDEIGDMTDSFKEAAETLQMYINELSRGLGEVANGNFNISSDVEFKASTASVSFFNVGFPSARSSSKASSFRFAIAISSTCLKILRY